MPFVTAWVPLLFVAQDPLPAPDSAATSQPSPEQRTAAVEAATAELRRLAPRARLAPEAWNAAEKKLGEAIAAFVADPKTLEWDHVARAVQTTWRTQCPGACAALCELALARFPETAEVHVQLGMSRWSLAQHADLPFESRRLAAQAASAFKASRRLGQLEPAYVFLGQALLSSLDYQGALAELEVALAHPKFGGKLTDSRHGLRANFLLAAGRAADAVTEMEASVAAKEEARTEDAVIMARALALAGRTEEAIDTAKTAHRSHPSAAHLTLLADLLAFAGRHDEALALLKEHPIERGDLSDDDFGELRRTRAALEFVIGLRGKRPPDLRQQLVKVLGHEVRVGTIGGFVVKHGAEAEIDLNASPHAIGAWLCKQPSSAFTWANDALFVVCVEDAPKWEGGPLERGLLQRYIAKEHWQAITGEDALTRARAVLAGHRLMEYAEGILTVSRLLGM